MKIEKDKQIHLLENLTKTSSLKPSKDASAAAQQAVGMKDKVELSGLKEEVSRISEKVKAIPAVREDKVQAVQESLEMQTYNVRGELVARSLMKNHLLDEIL
jgi:flagellar biosynthesis anti-sigma factor FlgM